LQTIDVSRGGVFQFVVTDLLGVKTPSHVRAEVAGIALDTESERDLADPLGSYRALAGRQIHTKHPTEIRHRNTKLRKVSQSLIQRNSFIPVGGQITIALRAYALRGLVACVFGH
jgi:hypothetical protein